MQWPTTEIFHNHSKFKSKCPFHTIHQYGYIYLIRSSPSSRRVGGESSQDWITKEFSSTFCKNSVFSLKLTPVFKGKKGKEMVGGAVGRKV
jgi:hypothetical protein